MKKTFKWLCCLISSLFIIGCGTLSEASQATITPESSFIPTLHQPAAAIWLPLPGTSWQWQLTDLPLDTSVNADMYDIDVFDTEAAQVAQLHTNGKHVVCYINAGAWENWRADASAFPAAVLGNDYGGWPGERWLDIRRIDLLEPIMVARFDMCRDKGFDGVEPDNIDAYTNDTGFLLTADDQLRYNRWLAQLAHERGLSIGLKNNSQQVAELIHVFDWALSEDCFADQWCDNFVPFITANKAVFAAEYTDNGATTTDFCPYMTSVGFSAILKQRDLNGWRETCDG